MTMKAVLKTMTCSQCMEVPVGLCLLALPESKLHMFRTRSEQSHGICMCMSPCSGRTPLFFSHPSLIGVCMCVGSCLYAAEQQTKVN